MKNNLAEEYQTMKVYAAYKNDEILKGRLFALPEHAFNFFCEEFTKIYPNAKDALKDMADNFISQLKEENYISIQAEKDEWGIKTYISIS